MWRTTASWWTAFARCGGMTAKADALWQLDEILLLVLRLQPAEIDGLEMDDYWQWVGAADREIKRRIKAQER